MKLIKGFRCCWSVDMMWETIHEIDSETVWYIASYLDDNKVYEYPLHGYMETIDIVIYPFSEYYKLCKNSD